MAEIGLTKSYVAIVDDADFEWLSQWRWHAVKWGGRGSPYAMRGARAGGVQRGVYMHRALCQAPEGFVVDHINGDTLDNRRENLRPATISENSRNKRVAAGRCGYRGVRAPDPANRTYKYRAILCVEGRATTVGWGQTADEAARIYDAAAKARFGEFAKLNFPDERHGEFAVPNFPSEASS